MWLVFWCIGASFVVRGVIYVVCGCVVGFGASVQGCECGAGAMKWPPFTNSSASASAATGIGGVCWCFVICF